MARLSFPADLYLLRPKDTNKGNHACSLKVSNRGGRGILSIVNGRESEYGDGFLMREGYTIAWVGMEFDLSSQGEHLRLSAPVAHDPDERRFMSVRTDFTRQKSAMTCRCGHILLGPDGGNSYPVMNRRA